MCHQHCLGPNFKLPFLTSYSDKIEILTPLYYINNSIKWVVGGLGIEFLPLEVGFSAYAIDLY